MTTGRTIQRFIFPPLTLRFLVRVAIVALSAYLFFGHICIPLRIKGRSMEPTYHDGGVNFCWRLRYAFSGPNRHDVVAVRFAGRRVILLKRVVALEGEAIAFRNGKLFVENREIDEPYVRYPCDWNLRTRRVRKNHVYVIGDNRSVPMDTHYFGQTSVKRVIGGPLW